MPDRIDELGNQIVAPLELDIDVAPGRHHPVLVTDQAIVDKHPPEQTRQQHHGENDQGSGHGGIPAASIERHLYPDRLVIRARRLCVDPGGADTCGQ